MTLEELILPITIGCAVVGALIVLLWVRHTSAMTRLQRKPRVPILEIECTECHRNLIINPLQLQQLSQVEKALAVRSRPHLVSQKLAEYVCPFCESAHCFVLGKKLPEWVGANLYQGHSKSANCYECRVPLRRPGWPKGAYDGKVDEAPAVFPDHGMVCSRCHAVCCHGCCEEAGKRRGEVAALYCPRCMRKSISGFYHP